MGDKLSIKPSSLELAVYKSLFELSAYIDVLLSQNYHSKGLPVTRDFLYYKIKGQADSLKELLVKLYFE